MTSVCLHVRDCGAKHIGAERVLLSDLFVGIGVCIRWVRDDIHDMEYWIVFGALWRYKPFASLLQNDNVELESLRLDLSPRSRSRAVNPT